MKKIINGKHYDTETARKIGEAYSNAPISDFGWWEEAMYLKRTGEYFLAGEGHACTKYAESYDGGDSWGPGKGIFPITEAEAREWAERYLSVEQYEELFPIPDEPDACADFLALRQSTGLSQAAFAERYDIPLKSIQNWEQGLRVPPPYVLVLLERAVKEDFSKA